MWYYAFDIKNIPTNNTLKKSFQPRKKTLARKRTNRTVD